ncbi:hypothetical protein NMG60_11005635 [Bertholletia excelsa]
MVRPSGRRERDAGGSGGVRYKGVRMRKWGKWVAEVRQPNSRDRIWLGSYDTAEEAARAYDAAVFCLRGSATTLNFPDDPPEIPSASDLSPPQIQVAASRHAHRAMPAPRAQAPASATLFRESSSGEFCGGVYLASGFPAAEERAGGGGSEGGLAVPDGQFFGTHSVWTF